MTDTTPKQETIADRGTDALRTHVASCSTMDIRQTKRGAWMEMCCSCEAKTEFKYFIGENQVAHSLEDSPFCTRCCCGTCYSWTMVVKELNTDAELLTVERPWQCCAGACKCCCYQRADITSGGQPMGYVVEGCYFCVPTFNVYDYNDTHVYKVHQPTCICGMCVQICSEGNPCCGAGCCKVPFWIFDASQTNTDGDAEYVGKILKKPKSLAVDILTEAEAFEVNFPADADVAKKATLIGTALLFNSLFFEGNEDSGS